MNTAIEVKNPFAFDARALLPNAEIMDLPRFYTIAGDVIEDALDTTSKEIAQKGVETLPVQVDVSSFSSVEDLVKKS